MNQNVNTADFAQGPPDGVPPLSKANLHGQPADVNRGVAQGSTTLGGSDLQRADSTMSQSHTLTPSRGGTLKKRQSLNRKNSLNRSASKKGSRPSSVKSLKFADDVGDHGSEMNDAFFTPVPTSGSPTEVLANRFQGKVLEDFRMVISSKALAEWGMSHSMAEGTQGSDRLLPRRSKVVRFSI